jgi:hypothetical protein
MARPEYFYFSTTKNLIAAFGILFKDIKMLDDFGNLITVPIHYSPQEKFIALLNEHEVHDSGYEVEITLPRFGFEMTGMSYDTERVSNPMSQMHNLNDFGNSFMFSRIPYNFSFTLYLAVRKFEDGLKIVEQIVPFFTPDLNISIKDKEDFGYSTDIPFILDDVSFDIDYKGAFDTRRTILWTFQFTAKAWLYSNVRESARIKETIVKMGSEDFSKIYETLISEVDPRSAEKNDPHTIVDSIVDGDVDTVTGSNRAYTGERAEVDLTKADPAVVVREIWAGGEMMLVEFSTS